jgi:hypothetical protein
LFPTRKSETGNTNFHNGRKQWKHRVEKIFINKLFYWSWLKP